eukprot:TRINITY_DN1668_c0_g1_i3.p1 TRINITY_DN1668_c0_g1~~TRINITY_DN1668_c0_g1_i3.p1  ORF type:complete len:167 (+),score=29.42 TRINITY_DN1668_c0_g1_i3:303-803(+)
MRIAKEIAVAMVYLHQNNPIILHRDLSTNNILVTRDYSPKITDFGFAKLKDPSSNSVDRAPVGTVEYWAPEMFTSDNPYTTKWDVFSYSIILWELSTRKIPFEGMENSSEIHTAVCQGVRPPTDGIPPALVELLNACWSQNPADRPSFLEVVEQLEGVCAEQAAAT